MNFKEKINRLHKLEAEIHRSTLLLKQLETAAAKMTPVLHYAPSGPGGESRSLEKLMVRIADMRKDVNRLTAEYFELNRELVDLINKLPDENYSDVLTYRCIQGLSWPKVANELHFSDGYTRRLFKKAMDAIEKL